MPQRQAGNPFVEESQLRRRNQPGFLNLREAYRSANQRGRVVKPAGFWSEAMIPSHSLKVKTCDDLHAGTRDLIYLSFCTGDSSCNMGPPNVYNTNEELGSDGTWNNFVIPLEYDPMEMRMTIDGHDAWCIEEMLWDGGSNLLGDGGRIYFDGELGDPGCNYGVHIQTGWFFPCQRSWRFFNLMGLDEYRYEVAVKACSDQGRSPSWPSSPRVSAGLCSESQCNDTVGDVVSFDLSLTEGEAAGGGLSNRGPDIGWATTLSPVAFNPVALTLVNFGDAPWCAEEIVFNGFTLANKTVYPQGVKLGVGSSRLFFNVQALGVAQATSSEATSGVEGDGLKEGAWDVLTEVVTAVVVFTATVVATSFIRWCTKPLASKVVRKRKEEKEEKGNQRLRNNNGRDRDEAHDPLLLKRSYGRDLSGTGNDSGADSSTSIISGDEEEKDAQPRFSGLRGCEGRSRSSFDPWFRRPSKRIFEPSLHGKTSQDSDEESRDGSRGWWNGSGDRALEMTSMDDTKVRRGWGRTDHCAVSGKTNHCAVSSRRYDSAGAGIFYYEEPHPKRCSAGDHHCNWDQGRTPGVQVLTRQESDLERVAVGPNGSCETLRPA